MSRAIAISTRKAAKYGHAHRQMRAGFARLVASGMASCSRCGDALSPVEPWDLDHRDDGVGYAGPAHVYCNRAAGAALTDRRVETYEDDPERGIFWGPPDDRGRPRRWSRPWFKWRPA